MQARSASRWAGDLAVSSGPVAGQQLKQLQTQEWFTSRCSASALLARRDPPSGPGGGSAGERGRSGRRAGSEAGKGADSATQREGCAQSGPWCSHVPMFQYSSFGAHPIDGLEHSRPFEEWRGGARIRGTRIGPEQVSLARLLAREQGESARSQWLPRFGWVMPAL